MSQAEAQRIVDTFLRSLQKLDDTIISSARSKTPVPDSAGKEVEQAVQDLDRLAGSNIAMSTHLFKLGMAMPQCLA